MKIVKNGIYESSTATAATQQKLKMHFHGIELSQHIKM